MSEARAFQYEAIGRDGQISKGVLSGTDEAAVLRKLSGDGLTILKIAPAATAREDGKERALRPAERVLVLRQLALMLEAGVSLLESLETVAQGMQARKGRRQFQAATAALRLFGGGLEQLGELLDHDARQLFHVDDGDGAAVPARDVVADADGDQFDG